MKPRLKFYRGLWNCYELTGARLTPCGVGWTPEEAYEHWLWLTFKQLEGYDHA